MRHSRQTVLQLTLAAIFSTTLCAAEQPIAEPAQSNPFVIKTIQVDKPCFAVGVKSPLTPSSVNRHVLLIDTSASQTGTVRESFLQLTSTVLASLSPRAQVQIFAADVNCESLTDGFVPVGSKNMNNAVEQLSRRTPLGTTNLPVAFQTILKSAAIGSATSVLYIGDGLTTANLLTEQHLRDICQKASAANMSVHSLVVGPETSMDIPGILANLTGGTARAVAARAEKTQGTLVALAMQQAAVRMSSFQINGKDLSTCGHGFVWLRSDRHAILLGEGLLTPVQQLTAVSDSGVKVSWKNPELLTAGGELPHLVQRSKVSGGVDAPTADLDLLNAAQAEFASSVAKSIAAGKYLQRQGRNREAIEVVRRAANMDKSNGRLKAVLTAVQQQVPVPDETAEPFLAQDAAPAPAQDGAPAAASDAVPAPAGDAPLNGENNVPVPAGDRNPGFDPVPNPNTPLNLNDQQNPGFGVPPAPGFGENPPPPLNVGATGEADPLSEVDRQLQLQAQILVQETSAAIDEARAVAFDQPEYAINRLKDVLETIRASRDIGPDVRAELERRVQAAVASVRTQLEVNTLRGKQIAKEEAVQEAQRKVLSEESQEEERLAILIDQVRGLLNRARKGDRNGYEEAEVVSRTALDLRPGNGPATQALVMSEALGQLEKAYRLVNLRHDKFLETLYQVELSHVPFPDEPPILYPPADVWRQLTLVRKPKYESFDLRSEKPVEKWLRSMLDKPVPQLDFPGETPLSEILETISVYFTTTWGSEGGASGTDFRMTIYPDHAELELESITSLEDVTVKDINFEGLTLRNALKLIFDQTTEPELTYVIENEVFKVTTLAKAESDENLVTRVYPVADLVIPPVNLGGGGGGGFGGGQQGGGGFGGGQQGGGGFGGGQQGGGGFGGGGGGQFSVPAEWAELMKPGKTGISTDAVKDVKKKQAAR